MATTPRGTLGYGYTPNVWSEDGSYYYPALKKGDKDAPQGVVPEQFVKQWQAQLISLGYGPLLGSYGADGDFGSKTRDATKEFQKQNRLSATGQVGAQEWALVFTGSPVSTKISSVPATTSTPSAPQLPAASQASMLPGGLLNQPWFYPLATVTVVGTMVLILTPIMKKKG